MYFICDIKLENKQCLIQDGFALIWFIMNGIGKNKRPNTKIVVKFGFCVWVSLN